MVNIYTSQVVNIISTLTSQEFHTDQILVIPDTSRLSKILSRCDYVHIYLNPIVDSSTYRLFDIIESPLETSYVLIYLKSTTSYLLVHYPVYKSIIPTETILEEASNQKQLEDTLSSPTIDISYVPIVEHQDLSDTDINTTFMSIYKATYVTKSGLGPFTTIIDRRNYLLDIITLPTTQFKIKKALTQSYSVTKGYEALKILSYPDHVLVTFKDKLPITDQVFINFYFSYTKDTNTFQYLLEYFVKIDNEIEFLSSITLKSEDYKEILTEEFLNRYLYLPRFIELSKR